MLDSCVARANSSNCVKFSIIAFALFALIACGDDQTFPIDSNPVDSNADTGVDRADGTSSTPSSDAGLDTADSSAPDANVTDASDDDFEPTPIPMPDAGNDSPSDTGDQPDQDDEGSDDWGDWDDDEDDDDWDDSPQDAGTSPEPEPDPDTGYGSDAGSPSSSDTGWPEDIGGSNDEDDDDDWSWPGWGNRDAGGSSGGGADAGGSWTDTGTTTDAGGSWTDTGTTTDTGGGSSDTGGSTTDTGGGSTDTGSGGTVTACADNDGVCGTDCTMLEDNNCVLDCRDASTWPDSWVTIEDQVLQLTNAERAAGASCGTSYYSPKPPLTSDADLREAARCHSYDMAIQDFFSHTSPNGDSMSDRVNATGYSWRALGENIAVGYSSPSSVMSGWMNSPGHCQNIMSTNTELGVGYVDDVGNGRPQWTQDFGTPR